VVISVVVVYVAPVSTCDRLMMSHVSPRHPPRFTLAPLWSPLMMSKVSQVLTGACG